MDFKEFSPHKFQKNKEEQELKEVTATGSKTFVV